MPPRLSTEAVDWVFDLLFDAANVVKPCSDLREVITSVRSQIFFKAANDFSIDEAIEEFGLKYQVFIGQYWDIEKEVEGKEFPTTPYIGEPALSKHMDETDPVIADRITTRQLLNEL